MLHTQQHIHVYNRQKNEAIVVRKSATKNDFAVKTKFFYFFLALLCMQNVVVRTYVHIKLWFIPAVLPINFFKQNSAKVGTTEYKMLFSKEAKLDTNLGLPISCVSFLATSTYYHIYPLQKQPPLVFFSFQSAMLLV